MESHGADRPRYRPMIAAHLGTAVNSRLPTTRWSLVLAYVGTSVGDDKTACNALAELCRIYWRPIFAFISKRGYSSADAQDLTQDFFLHILESDLIRRADREQGKFRSLLLTSLKNFLIDEFGKQRRQKRGGHVQIISWDDWMAQGADQSAVPAMDQDRSADKLFDLQWATTIVNQALRRLREECESRGHRRLFEHLKPCLTGERAAVSYASAATALDLSESAVKNLVFRLRQRYGALLRQEVAETLDGASSVEEEVRYLCSLLATEVG